MVFLCPGCELKFIAGRYAVRFASCPVCGDSLLRGLLVLALHVGILFGLMPLFLGFRGGVVRFFLFWVAFWLGVCSLFVGALPFLVINS